MFSSIRRFLKRHQNKFLVGGIFIGGMVFMTHYAQRKIREWQEREIKTMLERTKKQQHFEHLEKTSNNLILTLALNVRNVITTELDTKVIINQLKSDPADKLALWNELKVLSFARSATIIYAYTMLVTFIRIQIHVISGHKYLYHSENMDNDIEYNIQVKYLQLANNFISGGTQKLCNIIKNKVEQITSSISLDTQLTLRDLEQIYWTITSSIFADTVNDPVRNFTEYTMLEKDEKIMQIPKYAKIIEQTLDLLESIEVQNLIQSNIRTGFASFIDHIFIYFNASSETKNGKIPEPSSQEYLTSANTKEAMNNGHIQNKFVDINKNTMPVAKIIPILNGQVPDISMPYDVATIWLQRLMSNNEIKILGANIYEALSYPTKV